jgi:hypothetical protein
VPNQLPQATLAALPTVEITSSPAEITSVISPTPVNLGIETEQVVNSFSDAFTFSDIEDIDGMPTIHGVTSSSFSNIYLIGHPYLVKAKITIELGSENRDLATSYWTKLLKLTTQNATEATEWVQSSYKEAALEGKELEHNVSDAKIILKIDNGVNPYFILTVLAIGRTQPNP